MNSNVGKSFVYYIYERSQEIEYLFVLFVFAFICEKCTFILPLKAKNT